jgi:hypothetical protein
MTMAWKAVCRLVMKGVSEGELQNIPDKDFDLLFNLLFTILPSLETHTQAR